MAELQNARHEKFAQGIASGLSQRKAYRAAFPNANNWKDETVDSKASTLAKNEKVLARLLELAGQTTSKAVMSIQERKEWLTEVVNDREENMKNRLRAVDTLNKMDGAYIENIKVNGQINNPMQGLTTEELRKIANGG